MKKKMNIGKVSILEKIGCMCLKELKKDLYNKQVL